MVIDKDPRQAKRKSTAHKERGVDRKLKRKKENGNKDDAIRGKNRNER